ncbi:WYL domain-containing protein [Xylanimonas oleitrophica]|uniref:WYL domain-containing protein n=1 Tax=Xylanimonas oleitrophica TaxID=2607479 RepID=A0A2W5WMS2_9MICO|nr:WYL domain-containing protein [Xylanimonas oleitrophica]PZR52839.1 WYL domain-containing protein [Xylanimonas oleitrophica]
MPEESLPSVPPAERLLNLVIALVNTSVSMTKQQIRRGVAGYGDAPSVDAFERMFERDKDTLRALGVPIVTVDSGGHSDDVGYRIDNDAYALPAVDLTPAELGVLALAAQLWSDKTLRTDISRAMTKLRAAGAGEAASDALAGLAPRVRAVGDAYGPLLEAVTERRVVTFRYRAASTGQVTARHVEPWRIAARGGGWYLVGRDQDRQAPRVFRLSRIEGRVRVGSRAGAFEIPADLDVDALLGARTGRERTAVLAVVPERASAVRARAVPVPSDTSSGTSSGTSSDVVRDASPGTAATDATDAPLAVPPAAAAAPAGRDVLAVRFTSLTTLAEELAGYADAVVVLAPPELRTEVVRRLQAAAGLAPRTPHHRPEPDEETTRG